jgi:glycosyltransferase involved in cell wall biosynthesis
VAGEARGDKNLGILPDAIRRYFSAGGRGTFNIQLQPMLGNGTEKLIRRDLPRLRKEFPGRVSLLAAPLYGDAFYAHIAGSDAVLLTYPGQHYQNRISQIALEAAAFGVSCVAARHSSMEEELARLDNGSVFMEKADAGCLAAAMLDFEQNLAGNRAKAARGGEICRAYHNADTYFDIIADPENFAYPDYARVEPLPPRHPLPEIQNGEECACAS